MIRFGLLDGAISSPIEMIMYYGLWIPILIATLVVGGLIALFIKINKDKKGKKGDEQ